MLGLFKKLIYLIGCLLLVTSCSQEGIERSKVKEDSPKVSFVCILNKEDVLHKLFEPGDPKDPHPFYKDRSDEPIYPYPNACGSGTLLFDPDTNELHYSFSYSGLSGRPIMMHFHIGSASQSGPIIQTIFGKPYGPETVKGLGSSEASPTSGKDAPYSRSGFVSGVYQLNGNAQLNPPLSKEQEIKALFNEGVYVNIHTYLNELGEIRGQIIPSWKTSR